MYKENRTKADILNAYVYDYLGRAGGESRNVTYIASGRNSWYGESYYSQNSLIRAKGHALYEYLAQGPNVEQKENGFSIACEIIAYALLDEVIFKGGRKGYFVLFTPSQLDRSKGGSRGFDLLVTRPTKTFTNGQFVNDGVLGIDVTRSTNRQSIQVKKGKRHFRSEIELPVVVLPIAQLPKFADLVKAYWKDVVSGKNIILFRLPQEFQHMEGTYHQRIITLVLDEKTRIKEGLKKPGEWEEDKLGDFEKFLIS